MSDSQRPTVTITGNINAANVNTGEQTFHGLATFTFTMATGSDDASQKLQMLLQQLADQLASVPPEQKDNAETVAALAQDAADESSREAPRPRLLEIKGENLVKAAQNLLTVAPIAVEIARTLLLFK